MNDVIIIEDLDTTVVVEVEEPELVLVSDALVGPVGDRGPIGPAGPQGAVGPQGAQGAKGDKGDKGEQGFQGIVGPAGPTGDRGIQGLKGDVGPKGDQGVEGPVGPQGFKGVDGPQGPVGPTGPQGAQGVQGPVGPIGPTGPTGPTGPIGPTGIDGPSGGVWRTANGLPNNSLGADGDFYLDDNTGNTYQKVNGSYVFVINIIGPAGPGSGDMVKSAYDSDGDGKVNAAVSADQVPWSGVSGKPTAFTPSAHNHPISDVTGLQTALDGKQPLNAGLTEIAALNSDGYVVRISGGYATEASSFAPLNSPGLTGTPTGPTAAAYMKNTMLANTTHVHATVTTQPENYLAENYTLTINDAGRMVTMDNAAARTITIPPYSSVPFATNTRISVMQLGVGAVNLVAGSGVSIISSDGDHHLGDRFVQCWLWNHSRDIWVLTRGSSISKSHTHTIAQVTGLQTAIDAKVDKTYVDAADAHLSGRIDGKVAKTGDTMSGNLEIGLAGNPTLALHSHGVVIWNMSAGSDGSFNLQNSGGAWGMHRSSDGGVYFPGNVVAYWSDARLKEEIADLDGYEARIMGLRPVSFQWNERGRKFTSKAEGQREIGFIAQEAAEVCDQYVVENKTSPEDDGIAYLTVQKDQMIADLVAMVQALNVRLNKLEGML